LAAGLVSVDARNNRLKSAPLGLSPVSPRARMPFQPCGRPKAMASDSFVPIGWRCPNCDSGDARDAVTHMDCGGLLYRDVSENCVFCSVCGEEITYLECDDCGYQYQFD
jgi:rubredoxin